MPDQFQTVIFASVTHYTPSQHQVLKRMGGVQSNSHTCRLLEHKYVQRIVEHYGTESPIPNCLEDLCRNKLPKGRQGGLN